MRKCVLTLLLCWCAFSLSGCAIQDAIDEWTSDRQVDDMNEDGNSVLAADSVFKMSAATETLAAEYRAALDKLNNIDSGRDSYTASQDSKGALRRGFSDWWNSTPFSSGHSKKGWERELEQQKITVDKLAKKYETAKASDEVYQKSVEDSKKDKTNSILDTLKPFLIGAAIFVVVMFLILMISKRPRAPKVHVTPAPAPSPATASAPMSARVNNLPPVQRTGLLGSDDSQQRDFQNFCSENGLDYNAIVAKVGTDAASIAKAKTKINYLLKHGGVESVNLWLQNA